MNSVPPLTKSISVQRVIKHLNTIDRVTKALNSEEDVPGTKVEFYSPNETTIIHQLIMNVTGTQRMNITIKINIIPSTSVQNWIHNSPGILQPGDQMIWKDFIIPPNYGLQCHVKLDQWKPEFEFPDLVYHVTAIFVGPLEVVDE